MNNFTPKTTFRRLGLTVDVNELILNEVVAGIFVIDYKGIIVKANKYACSMFGYDSDSELIGHNIKILMPDPDKSKHDKYITDYFETGITKMIGTNRTVNAQKKNLEHFKCRLGLSKIRTGVGESRDSFMFVGLLHDLTSELLTQNALKDAELAKVEHAKISAENALKDRVTLINYIFHEVRNPINVLSAGIETLEDKLKGEIHVGNMKRIISLMRKSVERATRILNDTLDYTKFETKLNVLELTSCDIGKVIEEAVVLNKIKAETYNIDIYSDIDKTLKAKIDKDRIFQVINNLLSNAIKFTPEGGKIFVSLKTNRNDKNRVTVIIEDTGCGISPENLKQVFKPYNNISASHNNAKIKGMGLGLSITKKIVELHSTSLNVESTIDRGTKFSFDLIKSFDTLETKIDDLSNLINLPENSKGVRLLLIDDDMDNIEIMKELLETKGFKTEFLNDGQELIDCVKTGTVKNTNIDDFDIVLLDNVMKLVNGSKALEICRDEYGFGGKVAILSGCVTSEDKAEFLNAGADWILEKPFNFGEFLKIFDELKP